ncbi:GNAT family N-acetyltransferase [Chitinispirillales bacterium ANBcel5]|nr:GNAT family N-acetyltransferase [Chitinispirillales bacterium ANBcel5]
MGTTVKEKALALFAALNESEIIGYCIASADKNKGEIDSLYIKEQFRNHGLGAKLMSTALSWLRELPLSSIQVYVAEGNEEALGFYRKFGFKDRFHVLQL